jgi:hypothetical protein
MEDGTSGPHRDSSRYLPSEIASNYISRLISHSETEAHSATDTRRSPPCKHRMHLTPGTIRLRPEAACLKRQVAAAYSINTFPEPDRHPARGRSMAPVGFAEEGAPHRHDEGDDGWASANLVTGWIERFLAGRRQCELARVALADPPSRRRHASLQRLDG